MRTAVTLAEVWACLSGRTAHAQSTGRDIPPLPMKVLEACVVEFRGAGTAADWAGRVAVYDATADESGVVTSLDRRSGEKTVAAADVWVRLDQFEQCIRRWRFGSAGKYIVSLLGGTYSGGWWTITARNAKAELRLRVPQSSRSIVSMPPR